MGAGIASLNKSWRNNPHVLGGMSVAGGLAGLVITERYLRPDPDAGRSRFRVTFNPTGIAAAAARTPGNHSLIDVRF
jgi:hypothetical protein